RFERPRRKGRRAGRRPVGLAESAWGLVRRTAAGSAAQLREAGCGGRETGETMKRTIKMRVGWAVPLSIAACFSLPPLAWAAGTTSPGANSVFVSASSLTLPALGGGSASLLTGTITKGKRRTVVAVEGMLTGIGSAAGPRIDEIWPTINGFVIEPKFKST